MPITYKSKGLRGNWRLEDLQKAVRCVLMYKMSEKSAAKTHGVPRQTLRRHLERERTGINVQKVLGRPKTLTAEQEDELGEVIIDMEKRLFGLTRLHVRRLAYRHCEANKISHTFNRTEECAGNDWLDTLMKNNQAFSEKTRANVAGQSIWIQSRKSCSFLRCLRVSGL